MAQLTALCRRFAGDRQGSVAIQTLIFSVLLFGATGLVLDAGRVYATHAQMQAYADQMALAAASELDGRADAIERATDAVFGMDGRPPFLAKAGLEVGGFDVASLDFYPGIAPSSRPQNDMTEAFAADARLASATAGGADFPGGDPVAAARAASVAVVSVGEKRLRSAIARLSATVVDIAISAGMAQDRPFADEFAIAAIAAASLERRNCAPLSTLVFCNPWEGLSPNPLQTPRDDPAWSVPGRSLMTFAPAFAARGLPEAPQTAPNTASIYPWDIRNQLFRLAAPVADGAGLCAPDNVPTLAGEGAGEGAGGSGAPDDPADDPAARDRCLMARAYPETVCWGPGAPLRIAPADGDMVARALGPTFDSWPAPFDQVLTAELPIGDTGLTRAQLFEPDRLATTTFESGDRHGPDPDTEPQQDGIPDYLGAPGVPYETVPMPGGAPLAGFGPPSAVPGIGHDPCHDGTTARYGGTPGAAPACMLDFVGDYHEGGSDGAAAVRAALEHYWSTMYGLDPGTLPGSVTSWYELYRVERELFPGLDTDTTISQILEYNEENRARLGLSSTTENYVKHGPDEYLTATGGALLGPGHEGRRLRNAMVNCAATVAAGADGSGGYPVDPADLRIVDVYLPEPPGIFCGPGAVGCPLESAVETRLFVELIDDVTEGADHRRFVAQLVR